LGTPSLKYTLFDPYAYESLTAQNHPDKVAGMAPEFRELAERKIRELNASAYDQIRKLHQQGRS
jgi:preprotein translocase subunit Sec63